MRLTLGVVALGTVSLAALTISCASIFSSGPSDLRFTSDPTGAQVIVNGENLGETPVTLQLHAEEDYQIVYRKEGCEDAAVRLQTHVGGGWVVLDILAGVIGVAVDAATGEWKSFDNENQFVALKCD